MPRITIALTAEQAHSILLQKKANKLAARKKRKELKAKIATSGWNKLECVEGALLPEQACYHQTQWGIERGDKPQSIFEYPGGWCDAYYKGANPETATEWIVITCNGGFYKVGAQYMMWHPNGSQALWSSAALKKSLKSLLTEGQTTRDKQYTT